MKRTKKVLTFTKIRIASMNFIKGGGDDGQHASEAVECQSDNYEANCDGTRNEASVSANPCGDECFGTRTDKSANQQVCFRTF